jgi:hypothetical protein
MNPNNGNFNIGGKGIVAVLVLAVLGGGFVAFNMMQNNNNPQITNENTSGGGNVNFSPNINPNIGNQNQQQQTGSSGSQSANGVSPTPDSDQSGKASSGTPIIDVQANQPVEWSFKFPVYRKEKDKCTFAGKESVSIIQDKGSFQQKSSITNGYGSTQITGTVRASGKADLSLKGNEFILSFESTEVKGGAGSSETIITGKATAPNCPEEKFELSKGS